MAKRKKRKSEKSLKLDAKALGLAGGILWAVVLFIWTWIAASTGWGIEILNLIAQGYIGLAPTAAGSIVGAIWAFIDAFVGLWIFAKLYNWMAS